MEHFNLNQVDLSPELRRALQEMNFTTATPIQSQAIPPLLDGKDIIGQAQTGTGKTAAFAIPMIERIHQDNSTVKGLVICPTRELALQVTDEFKKIARFKRGLRILAIYGGQPIVRQLRFLQNRPQIIVGTPGRIKDMIQRDALKLNHVEMVVLDEADEMLKMGFREDIERILKHTPCERQTALFSATMPQAVLELTSKYQQSALHIQVTATDQPLVKIEQCYFEVQKAGKAAALIRLLEHHAFERALIFCNTKWKVDALTQKLQQKGYAAGSLHGGKSQSQRDRIMSDFRKGTVRMLVATDVAARGLDVDNLEAVFNFDLPKDTEFYIHRIGRTGRAGKSGQSFTFVQEDELRQLKEIRNYPNVRLRKQEFPA